MMQIKQIESASEEDQYRNLVRYCFQDSMSQRDEVFPLSEKGSFAVGVFENDQLISGTIVRSYEAYIRSQKKKTAGISFVASYPHGRNKGYIKNIFIELMKYLKIKGYHLSVLYPFRFYFYRSFGYGNIGPSIRYRFSPDAIPKQNFNGKIEPFSFNNKNTKHLFNELVELHNKWIKSFDFGIEYPYSMEVLRKMCEKNGEYIYCIYSSKGLLEAYVQFGFKKVSEWNYELTVSRFVYLSAEGFKGLMSFLRSHRGGPLAIDITLPRGNPFAFCFKEPRFEITVTYNWMARPLDVYAMINGVLDGKKNINGKFSLKDPLSAENTGTYKIVNGTLRVEQYTGENDIPFNVFSSIAYGGCSPTEAISCGLLSSDSEFLSSVFHYRYNTFVTEGF